MMQYKRMLCTLTAAAMLGAAAPAPHVISAAAEESKVIALTFDDGPNTTTTNEVLDVLEQYNAKGTFFLIGNNINEASAVSVKRAYDMGCEIGNHSKSHSNMSSMTEEVIREEIAYVEEWVTSITGEGTKYFRPPFIDVGQTMYDVIDQVFICGIDPKDYMADVTAQERADFILNNAKDGVIVLLHDAAGNDQTVEALEIAIPQLMEQGYEFVTLSELFARQGETPNVNLMYSEVAKYPCSGYKHYETVFSGSVSGDGSAACWSESGDLDTQLLKNLGSDYAIEIAYESSNYPVIALQKWSGASIWHTVKPFYYNGSKACFLASELTAALESLGVDYTDLDRMSIRPFSGSMLMTQVDILVKAAETTTTPDDSFTVLRGDVNCDGQVKINDVILLNRLLAEDTSAVISEQGMANAESDGTDGINGNDAAAILMILAGL